MIPDWATLYFFPQLDSTSDWALRQIDSLPDHAVVVAEQQSGGRGRKGRPWSSGAGGLYFTWVFRSPLSLRQQPHYAQVAAVAIAEWMVRQGLRPELKWPNDLLCDGAKVCGILLDAVGYDTSRRLLLGIGLNLTNRPAVSDRPVASLGALLERAFDPLSVLEELMLEIRTAFDRLEAEGMAPFAEALRRFDRLIGTRQRLLMGEKLIDGTVEAVDNEGVLLFRDVEGTLHRVWSGELLT